MAALDTGLDRVWSSLTGDVVDPVKPPAQIPMSQQSAFGSHGYDMHPQGFVRLSGCQEPTLPRERKRALLLS
jgi:hypothetical protein